MFIDREIIMICNSFVKGYWWLKIMFLYFYWFVFYSKYCDLLYVDGVDVMFVVDIVWGGGYEIL